MNGIIGTELTPLQAEFCKLFVVGPSAGNGPRCVLEAGYRVADEEQAQAMAEELLGRPIIQRYIALLKVAEAGGKLLRSRPWDELLPDAQALQLELLRLGRDAAATMQAGAEVDEQGRRILKVERLTTPLVHITRVAADVAETVVAYAVGQPVARTEQGPPGSFRAQDLDQALTEIRESLALLEAAGLAGLIQPGERALGPGSPSDPPGGSSA